MTFGLSNWTASKSVRSVRAGNLTNEVTMENLTDEQLRRVTGDELRRLQAKRFEDIETQATLIRQRRQLVLLSTVLAACCAVMLVLLGALK